MRKSRKSSKLLDLKHGLPTTEADVLALRLARRDKIQDLTNYLQFLATFPLPDALRLAAKKGPAGMKPFELEIVSEKKEQSPVAGREKG